MYKRLMTTPAHSLEKPANTLYMLALSGDNDPAGGNGHATDTVTIDHRVIDAALDDFKIERKKRVGFHAAYRRFENGYDQEDTGNRTIA